ncbi:MAG: hypothetical protein ABIH82_05130 [Candidatus Woesearchaeota archaeon]
MARRFKAKKVYGQSKQDLCAFCGSIATQTTENGILVCRHHRESKLEEIKCTCGSWLEQKSGKFGPYFSCINCGNINFNKAMEMKSVMPKVDAKKEFVPSTTYKESFQDRENRVRREERKPKEITITSDDVEYFD